MTSPIDWPWDVPGRILTNSEADARFRAEFIGPAEPESPPDPEPCPCEGCTCRGDEG